MYLGDLDINRVRNFSLQEQHSSPPHNIQFRLREPIGPKTDVGSPDDDNGVLPIRLEHHNGVPSRRRSDPSQMLQKDSAFFERVLYESSVRVFPDLAHEESGVLEFAAAASLVGALAAGQRLPRPSRDRLPRGRQALDLDVNVGVGGAHDDHGLGARIEVNRDGGGGKGIVRGGVDGEGGGGSPS